MDKFNFLLEYCIRFTEKYKLPFNIPIPASVWEDFMNLLTTNQGLTYMQVTDTLIFENLASSVNKRT